MIIIFSYFQECFTSMRTKQTLTLINFFLVRKAKEWMSFLLKRRKKEFFNIIHQIIFSQNHFFRCFGFLIFYLSDYHIFLFIFISWWDRCYFFQTLTLHRSLWIFFIADTYFLVFLLFNWKTVNIFFILIIKNLPLLSIIQTIYFMLFIFN